MAADRQRADDRDADEKSLGDAATYAGAKARPARDDKSLGDERTVGGADAAGFEKMVRKNGDSHQIWRTCEKMVTVTKYGEHGRGRAAQIAQIW